MNPLIQSLKSEIKTLPEEELLAFAHLWTIEKEVARGEWLYPKGTVETNIYFIIQGAFKICYEIDAQEVIVGFGYKGGFVFDLPSFFSEQPSHFYIEALKKSRLIGLPKKDFYHLLNHNLTLSNYWRGKTEEILLDLVAREVDILTPSPQVRFERLMCRQPELFQHIPHKYIAAYLRMSPETLSRLQKS